MNWALFYSTFVLIFLAELGDKTQLAVLSQSAGSSSKWTVFLAGSLALIAATAMGVLAGELLRRVCPDSRLIKLCGGVLFLVFGVLILREAFAPRVDEPVAKVRETTALKGWMGRFVLRQAAAFEKAAADDYAVLAARASNSAERKLFDRLAAEEREHQQTMLNTLKADAPQDFAVTSELAAELPTVAELMQDAALAPAAVEHAIEHELRMVRFYEALAQKSTLPRLSATFQRLAREEQSHAERLRALLPTEPVQEV